MQVGSAFLADYVTVREQLLHVLGGGITRLWIGEFPTSLTASLGMLVEVHRRELDRPHELLIVVQDADGGEVLKIEGGFQVGADNLDVHESAVLPIALDLRPATLKAPGVYSVEIAIDGQYLKTIAFQARPRSEMPGAAAPP
jgi:hypothetical protein